MKYVLIDCIIGKTFLLNGRLLVNFWGRQKLHLDFQQCRGQHP